MSRSLYPYYEKELYFLRQSAREFAAQYPATAGRLLLEANRSVDPHVERLLEGFALLAGRVQHKLDDEFPELTVALLGLLYPHYLAPIPSFAILEFEPDPAGLSSPTGFHLPAGSRLHTQPIAGTTCRYRTNYPVTLWPLTISAADWLTPPFPRTVAPPPGTAAVLRLLIEVAPGVRFADLELDRLRLYLNGDPQVVADLYEVLLHRTTAIAFRDPDAGTTPDTERRVTLSPKECLFPVGYSLDEGLVPSPPHALPGYRLLTEYFAFPQKFSFLDLGGFAAARRAGMGRRIEVLFYAGRGSDRPLLEQGVDATTIRLGCTPAVNLFEQTAEPIRLTHARTEYRIVPDVAAAAGMEVYSVDSVRSSTGGGTETEFVPFFGRPSHGGEPRAYWHSIRRPTESPDDEGSEVYLSLVDLDFRPTAPSDAVLVVRTTCTNRNRPALLRQSGERVRFTPELAGPIARVRCLAGPTAPLRPFGEREAYWRLISHLNLNHFSLTGGERAVESIRGLLSLYDFTGEDRERRAAAVQAIDGLAGISSRPVVRRIGKLSAGGFARGLAIDLTLDEEKYLGHGAYRFAAMMERFFALHAAVNSFVQVTALSKATGEVIGAWPPRAGEQPVL